MTDFTPDMDDAHPSPLSARGIDSEPLKFSCPQCFAGVGQPCIDGSGPVRLPHPERWRAILQDGTYTLIGHDPQAVQGRYDAAMADLEVAQRIAAQTDRIVEIRPGRKITHFIVHHLPEPGEPEESAFWGAPGGQVPKPAERFAELPTTPEVSQAVRDEIENVARWAAERYGLDADKITKRARKLYEAPYTEAHEVSVFFPPRDAETDRVAAEEHDGYPDPEDPPTPHFWRNDGKGTVSCSCTKWSGRLSDFSTDEDRATNFAYRKWERHVKAEEAPHDPEPPRPVLTDYERGYRAGQRRAIYWAERADSTSPVSPGYMLDRLKVELSQPIPKENPDA